MKIDELFFLPNQPRAACVRCIIVVPFGTVFLFALKSTKGIEQRQIFAGVPNCHGCQGEGRGNTASLAHWLEKVSNECTRTPKEKSVCIHVACHYFFSSCKAAKSDRAAGKQETPCDSAGCVKERGLMRSSPPVPPSK